MTEYRPNTAETRRKAQLMAPVSIFKDIPLGSTAPAFAVNQTFNEDTHPNKVDLGIGGNFSFLLSLFPSTLLPLISSGGHWFVACGSAEVDTGV